MSFIRDKKEERTGYQISAHYAPHTDSQSDFVMVYGMGDTAAERVRQFREKGYVIHFMTGISWGHYIDYLYGKYDGREHWDEAQEDRFGNKILHSPDVPYMVPTIAFADYLSDKLRAIVDLGVEAIHVEEPEFWDRAGYSPAFRREFELYYRTPWVPPHESADAKYKCSKLKAYLFTRTIDRVSSSLKEYAKIKYGRNLRFYVPTHSLLNYTQWKIVSPEGKLADIPSVDGCIAQVWTGTSREKNWYDGKYAERTFETAYLEYGVMQELVKGTGRHMWFLHDPIEDNPIFDWNDYRENYFRIVTASLMHPKVNTYEICPWPNRVFEGSYPRGAENAEKIPPEYATILNNTFNTLGNIETGESGGLRVGILSGDGQLYQREYSDDELGETPEEITGTVLTESDKEVERFRSELFTAEKPDKALMLKYMASNAFPAFYGISLPLLKGGIPVRPVLLDNVRRYTGYLDDYDVLVMSYEYMKPDYPDVNAAVAEWVRQGGILIYVGDGFDPFNAIDSWWSGKYSGPAEHLFEMLEISPAKEKEIFECGKGTAAVWNFAPAKITFSKENSDEFRDFFRQVLNSRGTDVRYCNSITVSRNAYIAAAVMDESVSAEPLKMTGVFADVYSPGFDIITEKTLEPGENTLLLDLDKYEDNIIGTSLRIYSFETDAENRKAEIVCSGSSCIRANIRVRLPFVPVRAETDGCEISCSYEETGKTTLLSFDSEGGERTITVYG